MPELPEVESVRRLADRLLVGNTISTVEAVPDDIVYETPAAMVAQALLGAQVTGTGRKGKVFWWLLGDRGTLFGHLGMSGWIRETGSDSKRLVSHGDKPLDDANGRPRFLKLSVGVSDDRKLAFTDGRRLARIWLGSNPSDDRRVKSLGPDAWTDDLDILNLMASKAPVKSLLLDQSRFAGVGNWVADEVLLMAGISPHRTGASLSAKECEEVGRAIKTVLDVAVAADADPAHYPEDWLFHVRWGGGKGPVTLLGQEVRRDTIGGRTAAWLPARQR
ncbi:MAG: hypothetical protein JSS65_06025 [Armatimonadetes bacterium]|nr:hypothetical protein [Armatimonadota bacterium]